MTESKPKCLVCEQTSDEIPLLALKYRENQYWICPQHFPILIHQPEKLIGKLPGAEKITPHDH
jgi:hypothetical protein